MLEYRGGVMDGAPLDSEGFHAIARLPGRDVLHGQLVGLTASPLTGLVAGLSNLISGLGRQLAQIAEQGLVTGEAPAEAPAERGGPRRGRGAGRSEEPAADEETSEAPEPVSDTEAVEADQPADDEVSDTTEPRSR